MSKSPQKLPRYVRRYAKTGKFRAVVTVSGRRIHGPLRETPDEASVDALKLGAAKHTTKRARSITLEEGFGAVLADLEQSGASPFTAKFYRSKFRILTRPEGFGRHVPIDAIQPEHIRRYIEKRETKVSRSAVWQDIVCLRRILVLAHKNGALIDNPMDQVRKPKIRGGRFRALARRQIEEILRDIRLGKVRAQLDGNQRFANIVEFLWLTGVRRLELARLRKEDIDTEAAVMHVTGKTGNRTVPLSDRALEVAKEMRKQSRRFGFLTMTEQGISGAFDRYRSALKLEHFSPHVLRHSFATELVNQGVQPFVLAELMGHRDIKITMRYFHGRDAVHREAIEKLSGGARHDSGEL